MIFKFVATKNTAYQKFKPDILISAFFVGSLTQADMLLFWLFWN